MRYIYIIYRINFRMLEVRENEIALRKLSGGTAQFRSCTLEGTLHGDDLSVSFGIVIVVHCSFCDVLLSRMFCS